MTNWNPMFNWTHEEFINVVRKAFVIERKSSVYLDVEHSDRKNMNDIMQWASQEGYRAEEVNSDTIKISKVVGD